jgi:hypothetical protein
MRAVVLAVGAALSACGVANHYPPDGVMDAPAVEFRNAEGVGRWCTSPDAPGALSAANYRSCRDGLLAEGYREIGPWRGGPAPTAGSAALNVLAGGIAGVAMASAQSAHHRACLARAQVAR